MSQKEKEVKQSAAEVENENLETEHTEADNGETSAGTENQEAETRENEAKEAKDAKKDPKDAQIEELQDRLKRQMAEFDNFRKRTEKEKAAMYEIGAKDIIEKILPVVDNFERGLAQAPEDDPFAEGMQKIIQQATKERSEGTAINIAVMKKNKKFQKEQLASEGYTEIEEFFVDKM